jgi:hypothetical protein
MRVTALSLARSDDCLLLVACSAAAAAACSACFCCCFCCCCCCWCWQVGDYVLSPDIVVERKALPDLFASLGSGRLYNQVRVVADNYSSCLVVGLSAPVPCSLAVPCSPAVLHFCVIVTCLLVLCRC